MFSGLLIGIFLGILWGGIIFVWKDMKSLKYFLIPFIIVILLSSLIAIVYDNYAIREQTAKYEAAYQTYNISMDNPDIGEYEKVAILQTTIEINQEIAKIKTYVNSWISFGITTKNKEAVNNLRLIGE